MVVPGGVGVPYERGAPVQGLLDRKVRHFEDPVVRTLNDQGPRKTGVCCHSIIKVPDKRVWTLNSVQRGMFSLNSLGVDL